MVAMAQRTPRAPVAPRGKPVGRPTRAASESHRRAKGHHTCDAASQSSAADPDAPDSWLFPYTKKAPVSLNLPSVNAAINLPENDPSIEVLFESHPRVLSFSHRPMISLRHPFLFHSCHEYLRYIEASTPADTAKSRKRRLLQLEGTNLYQLLNKGTASWMAGEEKKWAELAHLFDVVALEDELLERQQDLLVSEDLSRAFESLWACLVPPMVDHMTQPAYASVNTVAFRIVLQKYPQVVNAYPDMLRHSRRWIDADWFIDTEGGKLPGVPFENFFLSMFEFIDNWMDACQSDTYSDFARKLLDEVRHNARSTT